MKVEAKEYRIQAYKKVDTVIQQKVKCSLTFPWIGHGMCDVVNNRNLCVINQTAHRGSFLFI